MAHLLSQGAVLGTTFALDDVAALGGLDVEDCARAGRAGAARRAAHRPGRELPLRQRHRPPGGLRVGVRNRSGSAGTGARRGCCATGPRRRPSTSPPPATSARRAPTPGCAAADAAERSFAHIDAERLLDRAVERGRPRRRHRAADRRSHLRRGQVRRDLGRPDDARADHETALELARELGDSELEARALEQLGWTAFYARDALVAVEFAEQATHLAESAAAAPRALPSATLLLGRVRHWDGDYAGADAAYDEVLGRAPRRTPPPRSRWPTAAPCCSTRTGSPRPRTVLARAAVLCRRTGEFRPLLQTLFFTALARGDTGDFAGALRAARQRPAR